LLTVEGQGDELGSFIFRTTGFNSIRSLTARLAYFEAVSGGKTRYLPLMLKLRAKSTTQSHRAPVYYVDLCLQDGVSLEEAVAQSRLAAAQQEEAGVDIAALELAARLALANGAFEEGEDEVPAIVEEFYPEPVAGQGDVRGAGPTGAEVVTIASTLSDRLGAKAQREAKC
jgi:hypothetical protein